MFEANGRTHGHGGLSGMGGLMAKVWLTIAWT